MLKKLGWTYALYHILVAGLLITLAIHDVDPDRWRTGEFQLELLTIVLFYLTEKRGQVLQSNIFRREAGLPDGLSFGSPLSSFIPSVSLI